jgi:hypothetical protein
MTLQPHLALAFVLTSGVAVVMVLKGIQLKALERRFTRCRVCGGVRGRSCTCRSTDV